MNAILPPHPLQSQPQPRGRIVSDDLLEMIVLWNAGKRTEALAMADRNRLASQSQTQTTEEANAA